MRKVQFFLVCLFVLLPLFAAADSDMYWTESWRAVKYDPAGEQQWAAEFSHYDYWYEYPALCGLAVDETGNLYLGLNYFAVVKFDAAGEFVYEALYDESGDQEATAITLDPQGNVVMIGSVYRDGSLDYQTAAFQPDGEGLWAAQYDGPEQSADRAVALAFGPEGYVHVTGESGGQSATIRYDAAGQEAWITRSDDCDGGLAIAVNSLGEVYVAGYAWETSGYPLVLVKYDAQGDEQWSIVNRDLELGTNPGVYLDLDQEGQVHIVAANYSKEAANTYTVLKYSASGELLWQSGYNGTLGYGVQMTGALVQADGKTVITGYDRDYDYYRMVVATVMFDADGERLWAKHYGEAETDQYMATAIAGDAAGGIFVTGYTGRQADNYDAITLKYNQDGHLIWETRYDNVQPDKICADLSTAIAVDAAGNIYIAGTTECRGVSDDDVDDDTVVSDDDQSDDDGNPSDDDWTDDDDDDDNDDDNCGCAAAPADPSLPLTLLMLLIGAGASLIKRARR